MVACPGFEGGYSLSGHSGHAPDVHPRRREGCVLMIKSPTFDDMWSENDRESSLSLQTKLLWLSLAQPKF
jgi:hypothetical protein